MGAFAVLLVTGSWRVRGLSMERKKVRVERRMGCEREG